MAFSYRKSGYQTRIREGRYDYLLYVKSKDVIKDWKDISPVIPPENLPLFEVGLLNDADKEKVKELDRKCRENYM